MNVDLTELLQTIGALTIERNRLEAQVFALQQELAKHQPETPAPEAVTSDGHTAGQVVPINKDKEPA